MATQIRGWCAACAAAVVLAMFTSGCALTAMVQVTPSIGTPGQPLTYQVKVTNPAACTLTSPELILVPLVPRDAEVDAFCSIAQNPALALCESVDDPSDLPPQVIAACCMDPTFRMQQPMLCDAGGAMFGGPETLAQQAESVLSQHPVTTTAVVAASDTTQAAVSCSFNGQFFDCLLDDIPAGQSESFTLTVTPTMSGSFANFLVVEGSQTCLEDQIPAGSTCLDTIVGAAPAPTLSHTGTAGAVLLLAAIAAWRIRGRSRRQG